MKYKQIPELSFYINQIDTNFETKTIKKIMKIAEKLKPYQEEYNAKIQELRLDNAAVDKDGILFLNEKGEYRFTKEGIKKLQEQIKELGEKDFDFKPIDVVNPDGLEDFIFLKDWTTGITFNPEVVDAE
jgi:hypothetical protein